MNLVLLLAALLPWARSPADALLRFYLAVGVLSIEMQLSSLAGFGTLRTLPVLNLAIAAAAAAWQRSRRSPGLGWGRALTAVAPWPAWALLALLVAVLNGVLPLEAADPYHLDRVAQIERLGSIAYDPFAEPKVNVMGWIYELVLADIRSIPLAGPALLRMHGVLGLLLFVTGLAAAREWLGPGRVTWPWTVMLVIPVVFHAFVLVKNDLFIAVAAFVILLWVVVRAPSADGAEIAAAGALAGFVIGVKLSNLPIALLLAGGVIAARGREWARAVPPLALGGLAGAAAGGLFFTLYQNARWYGDIRASVPVSEMGNLTRGAAESVHSVGRFAVSLFDLGQLTPRWWPGRGGWGGTFGLPFIWGAIVLAARARRDRRARWILVLAGAHFVSFAGAFIDADLAHRLVMASGLLVVAGAADVVSRDEAGGRIARLALVPVIALSAAQIARSAVLYLAR